MLSICDVIVSQKIPRYEKGIKKTHIKSLETTNSLSHWFCVHKSTVQLKCCKCHSLCFGHFAIKDIQNSVFHCGQ